MSKGLGFARMALFGGLAIIPLFAADAPPQTRSCWLRDLASPTTTNIYALCEQGSVWFSGDGGTTWASRETAAKEPLRAMVFLDANRGLAVGDAGLIMSTADASKTWTTVKSGTEKKLMDISFVGNTGWVVGYNGLILHTADGGRTWSEQKSGTSQTIESVFFLDDQHGWAIGWAGTILRTTDGGKTWDAVKTDAATWSLSSVYFRDLQNGWIVGFAGQIIRSSDGGKTWKAQTSPVKGWLTSVAFDKLNRGWITHDDGFLVSEDGGETWKIVKTGGRYFLSKVARVGDTVWALGQSTVLRQTGPGLEWKRVEGLTLDKSMSMGSAVQAPPGGSELQ